MITNLAATITLSLSPETIGKIAASLGSDGPAAEKGISAAVPGILAGPACQQEHDDRREDQPSHPIHPVTGGGALSYEAQPRSYAALRSAIPLKSRRAHFLGDFCFRPDSTLRALEIARN